MKYETQVNIVKEINNYLNGKIITINSKNTNFFLEKAYLLKQDLHNYLIVSITEEEKAIIKIDEATVNADALVKLTHNSVMFENINISAKYVYDNKTNPRLELVG